MISTYVDDIKKALSNELYFPALSLALTLPDICGSVEFSNKQIHERYIGWYDKYIGNYLKEISEKAPGNGPYLSGEIVYNLRNTFLHNGLPGVDVKKIKDENNQIKKFLLFVGDSRGMQEIAISTKGYLGKALIIDVSYLCGLLCDSAITYYENNMDKFNFNYTVITEEDLFGEHSRFDGLVDFSIKSIEQIKLS